MNYKSIALIAIGLAIILTMPIRATPQRSEAGPLPGSSPAAGAPAAAAQPTVNPCPGTPENELCDPIGSKSVEDLLKKMQEVIIKIAIPLAVIMIIWIGIQFFLSQGNPEKVSSARKALWWTIVGLMIILIGEGFVSLIRSILELSKG
ncbi:MAG: pilin [Patescibacteria group bacterium]